VRVADYGSPMSTAPATRRATFRRAKWHVSWSILLPALAVCSLALTATPALARSRQNCEPTAFGCFDPNSTLPPAVGPQPTWQPYTLPPIVVAPGSPLYPSSTVPYVFPNVPAARPHRRVWYQIAESPVAWLLAIVVLGWAVADERKRKAGAPPTAANARKRKAPRPVRRVAKKAAWEATWDASHPEPQTPDASPTRTQPTSPVSDVVRDSGLMPRWQYKGPFKT
jgi:hypothetical protein